MTKHPFATVVVGLIIGLVVVGLEIYLGPPGGLDVTGAPAHFPIVLIVTGLFALAPFLHGSLADGSDAGVVPTIGFSAGLGTAATASVLTSIGLWHGLGFTSFVVIHVLMVAGLAVLWLGARTVRTMAHSGDDRARVVRERRVSLDETLIDLESDCAALQGGKADALRRALRELRDEARFLTPRQLERSPSQVAQLWSVIESLRGAVIAAKQGSEDALDEAVAQAKAVVSRLKQVTV
jgi:hypothetical protein